MAAPAIFFPELAPEDIRYRYLKKKITTELNVWNEVICVHVVLILQVSKNIGTRYRMCSYKFASSGLSQSNSLVLGWDSEAQLDDQEVPAQVPHLLDQLQGALVLPHQENYAGLLNWRIFFFSSKCWLHNLCGSVSFAAPIKTPRDRTRRSNVRVRGHRDVVGSVKWWF